MVSVVSDHARFQYACEVKQLETGQKALYDEANKSLRTVLGQALVVRHVLP
jgi:hypothetical protein